MQELIDYIEELKFELRFLKKSLLEEIVEIYQRKIDLKVEQKESVSQILKSLPSIRELKESYYAQYHIDPYQHYSKKALFKSIGLSILIFLYSCAFLGVTYLILAYTVPFNVFRLIPYANISESLLFILFFIIISFIAFHVIILLFEIYLRETRRTVNQIYFLMRGVNIEAEKIKKYSIFRVFRFKKNYLILGLTFSLAGVAIIYLSLLFSNGIYTKLKKSEDYLNKSVITVASAFQNVQYNGEQMMIEFIHSEEPYILLEYDLQNSLSHRIENDVLILTNPNRIKNSWFIQEKIPRLVISIPDINQITTSGYAVSLKVTDVSVNQIKIDSIYATLNINRSDIDQIELQSADSAIAINESTLKSFIIEEKGTTDLKFKKSDCQKLQVKADYGNLDIDTGKFDDISILSNAINVNLVTVENKNFTIKTMKEHLLKLLYFTSEAFVAKLTRVNTYIFESNITSADIETTGFTEIEKSRIGLIKISSSVNEIYLDTSEITSAELIVENCYVKLTSIIQQLKVQSKDCKLRLEKTIKSLEITDVKSVYEFESLKSDYILVGAQNSNLKLNYVDAKEVTMDLTGGNLSIHHEVKAGQFKGTIVKLVIKYEETSINLDKSNILELIKEEK